MNKFLPRICTFNMTDAAKHGIKGFKAFVRTLGTIKEGASARENGWRS